MKLHENGAYLIQGKNVVIDSSEALKEVKGKTGKDIAKNEAKQNTIAYNILKNHNTSGNMEKLQIKFDKLTSHDITNSICTYKLSQQSLCSGRYYKRR